MAGKVGDGEGDYNNDINVIPLVDIMLVLLIIFIITVPVVTHAVKVQMVKNYNKPTENKPENISLSIDFEGQVYWNEGHVSVETLGTLARTEAVKDPQPEVHIRADARVRYQYVGDVITALQRNGLLKVAFLAEPPMRNAP